MCVQERTNGFVLNDVLEEVLRIPWTAKRTNASILEELDIQDRLFLMFFRWILVFFRHIVCRDENLERLVIISNLHDHGGRGKPLMRWTDQIRNAMGMPITTALQVWGEMEGSCQKH